MDPLSCITYGVLCNPPILLKTYYFLVNDNILFIDINLALFNSNYIPIYHACLITFIEQGSKILNDGWTTSLIWPNYQRATAQIDLQINYLILILDKSRNLLIKDFQSIYFRKDININNILMYIFDILISQYQPSLLIINCLSLDEVSRYQVNLNLWNVIQLN